MALGRRRSIAFDRETESARDWKAIAEIAENAADADHQISQKTESVAVSAETNPLR
jgi:hypothetical protein